MLDDVELKFNTALSEIKENGAEIQQRIQQRQSTVESKCDTSLAQVAKVYEVSEELKRLFDSDYTEFVKTRKRWKTEFIQTKNDITAKCYDLESQV